MIAWGRWPFGRCLLVAMGVHALLSSIWRGLFWNRRGVECMWQLQTLLQQATNKENEGGCRDRQSWTCVDRSGNPYHSKARRGQKAGSDAPWCLLRKAKNCCAKLIFGANHCRLSTWLSWLCPLLQQAKSVLQWWVERGCGGCYEAEETKVLLEDFVR